MSWEKNRFSNVMWFLYVLITGWALMRMAGAIVSTIPEGSPYSGALLALEIALVTGSVVFLLYRFRSRHFAAGGEGLSFSTAGQAIVTVMIMAAGLVFRISQMSHAGELAAYFETARVAQGQSLPRVVHGVSHIYLQLLHAVFLFAGNKFTAGILMQILLQLAGALLLYFAVRKLSGALAAEVSLIFIMFSGYMIQDAVNLSPRTLYFFLFSLGLFIMTIAVDKEPQPVLFLVKGIVIGVLGFLDVGGFLLLFFLMTSLQSQQQADTETSRKWMGLGIGLAGTAAGFFCMLLADALLSDRSLSRIFGVWKKLYWSDRFQVPFSQGLNSFGLVSILLLVTLSIGIFSYWCDRSSERMSVWVLTFCGAVIAGIFGVFTDEIPSDMYLYIITVVLAGIGLNECFRRPQEKTDPVTVPPDEENRSGTSSTIGTWSNASKTYSEDEIWSPAPRSKPVEETARAEKAAPVGSEAPAEKSVSVEEAARVEKAVPVEKTARVEKTASVEEAAEEIWGASSGRTVGQAADGAGPAERSVPVGSEAPAEKPVPVEETARVETATPAGKRTEPDYIENPLPLPKPHQKRELTFDKVRTSAQDDYDYPVKANDDFDIK